jgi:hypothetical protein
MNEVWVHVMFWCHFQVVYCCNFGRVEIRNCHLREHIPVFGLVASIAAGPWYLVPLDPDSRPRFFLRIFSSRHHLAYSTPQSNKYPQLPNLRPRIMTKGSSSTSGSGSGSSSGNSGGYTTNSSGTNSQVSRLNVFTAYLLMHRRVTTIAPATTARAHQTPTRTTTPTPTVRTTTATPT